MKPIHGQALLPIGIITSLLIVGCNDHQSNRNAAMEKRFAEIDSNFVLSIRQANDSEQKAITEDGRAFSNQIMSLPLDLTNTDEAGKKLTAACNRGWATTTSAMLVHQQSAQSERAEATNEMLMGKLAWFYSNSFPNAPVMNAPDNVLLTVSNIGQAVYTSRNNDIVAAGLIQIGHELSNIVASDAPLTDEQLQSQKKAARMAEIERQRQQSAVDLAKWRETDAVKKTAVRMDGEVFQITDGGMLVKYNMFDYDYQLAFIQDCNIDAFADGQAFRASVLYPIGTYRYNTAGGSFKTVKRFTANLDRAVEWHRSPW